MEGGGSVICKAAWVSQGEPVAKGFASLLEIARTCPTPFIPTAENRVSLLQPSSSLVILPLDCDQLAVYSFWPRRTESAARGGVLVGRSRPVEMMDPEGESTNPMRSAQLASHVNSPAVGLRDVVCDQLAWSRLDEWSSTGLG